MTPKHRQQIREVLKGTLEPAPAQRVDFLHRCWASDPSLRHAVELLLASSDDIGSSSMQSTPEQAARGKAQSDDGAVITPPPRPVG